MKIILFVFIISLICAKAIAQETASGDSTMATEISGYLRSIYDMQDTTLNFLTNQQLKKVKTMGNRIRVDKKAGRVQRIVIISFTGSGEFAEEYLFKADQLIFVYQTHSYFREAPSATKAINFLGYRYWESRYYFDHEKLKYQKTTGTKEIEMTYSERDLLNEKKKLLSFLKMK